MEVHHHPDLHHKPKPWKEYLLEGFMIFIAVTMGFFAESARESITENKKENEYVKSFVNDLAKDSLELSETILENQNKLKGLDSLLGLANADLSDIGNRRRLYKYASQSISFYSRFISNDATMMQLKNSGGLQYIRHHNAADSIAQYDQEMRSIYAAETPYAKSINDGLDAMSQLIVFNLRDSNSFASHHLPLLTNDPQKIVVFFNKVSLERGWTQNYLVNMSGGIPAVNNLRTFLKTEYHIDE
ncbi:MAG TPA: hypothetical protein VNW49_13240 [Puia sp.]|jgi:hypothetical protein|nr:hypothetical protein [Puia sp.]